MRGAHLKAEDRVLLRKKREEKQGSVGAKKLDKGILSSYKKQELLLSILEKENRERKRISRAKGN